MSKRIIMFDIDGVLADFILGFTTLASSIFAGVPVTDTKHQPNWDGFPGMSKEQIAFTWKVVDSGNQFWYGLPALVSRPELDKLSYLMASEHVYFVTNRKGETTLLQTKNWLYEHSLYNANVICTERKGEQARALGANYMIDDKAGNAIYAAYHAAPKLKSYILDRPYNQFNNDVVGSKVKRVHTIGDFLGDIWSK